jgi:hypothetical protein
MREKVQEMRWRSDLRNDEVNGHLAARRAFGGTGVDEEECLSEVLKIFNGTAAGKVRVGMVE